VPFTFLIIVHLFLTSSSIPHCLSLLSPNIIANVRHAWLDEYDVHTMWRNLKTIFEGGDSAARSLNEAIVVSGEMYVLRESWVRRSVLSYCACQKFSSSHREDV
jgi:hypothetical protein